MAKITTYDFIAANSRKTVLLMILFPISLIVMIYALILILSLFNSGNQYQAVNYQFALNNANIIAIWLLPIISVVAIIWLVISYFFGQNILLSQAGAKEVTRQSAPDIYNMTENLCITAGLPVPKIYIIQDNALNAFATGRNPKNSYIALTTGIIAALDKSELEGVIAHELSHISNRDIRLMLITILCISFATFAADVLLRIALVKGVRGNSKDNGGAQLFLMLLAFTFYIYGYLVAPLIRLAVSRTREFQADASAALLTRNPQGLAGALKKISGRSEVKSLKDNEPMAPMCIETPLSKQKQNSFFNKLSGIFSTHPPTAERIKKLLAMDATGRFY